MEQSPCEADKKGLYATPADALRAVMVDYHYWTGRLTETSAQMSYAVIAANWIVFGSINVILSSTYAKLSLLSVLLSLATSVVGTWLLCEAHRKQANYGDCDPVRWATEFGQLANTKNPWPFTAYIECAAALTRHLKAFFALAGGVFLVIGALLK